MSLIAATNTALCITGNVASKRTGLDLKRIRLEINPRTLAWSHDNAAFFVATTDAIYSFSCSSLSSEGTVIYNAPQNQTLQPVLLCRDVSTLIFAQGSNIYLLSLGTKAKLSNALIGHSTPIVSLSLSNDGSLLASASLSGTLCVHNLTHNSLTVLKGLPITSGTAKKLVCAFHSHTRTRLLLGCGKILAIYDVMRPSGPAKTIKFSEKDINITVNSFIIAIASSPFSKPLLAVAFNSGLVALIDLEKERSLLKVLDVNVPITTMCFTPDGTAIALGTEPGKIIVKGWRSVEEDDQMITLDENGRGERIVALSVQRRIKQTRFPSESSATPSSVTKPNAPLAELNNRTWINRRNKPTSPTESEPQSKKMNSDKVFSPPRSSTLKLDNVEDNSDMSFDIDVEVEGSTKSSRPAHYQVSDIENKAPSVLKSRPNSRSTTQTRTAHLATKPPQAGSTSTPSNPVDHKSSSLEFPQRIEKQPSNDSLKTHHKYHSNLAKATDNKIKTAVESRFSHDSQKISSIKSNGSALPSQHSIAITTQTADKKEKQVGWEITENSTQSENPRASPESSFEDKAPNEREKSGPSTEAPSVRNPEELMRRLIMDMMHEHRREVRDDIRGLHLDVLKLGRTWKSELRSLMSEHTRDLNALIEENERLRRENDELRRRL